MHASVEDIARDRDQEFKLGTEQRFPLNLTGQIESAWSAYETAIREVWDPEDPVHWTEFDPTSFDQSARMAGALVWSHRTWIDFPAIAESEAVLVRACLETGLAVDFKYCLTMRAVERARSTDIAHMIAQRLDSYRSSPPGSDVATLINDDQVRRVLHAETSFDAYLAAHVITQGEIDVAMWRAGAQHAQPALADVMALVIRDKQRMLDVAWDQIGRQLPLRTSTERAAIGTDVSAVLINEELAGRQVPAFLQPGVDHDALTDAHDRAAAAGLGGVPTNVQSELMRATIDALSTRLSQLDVAVDPTS